MSRENATLNLAAADYDAVMAQMEGLRSEMALLADHLKTTTGARVQALTKDVTDGMNDAVGYLGRKGHRAEKRVEGAIAANPYIALGLAAGLGLLLGALTRH